MVEVESESDWKEFALTEYEAIAHTFASGLNAMAVLLPLFFLFTGAVLNYVAGLFSEMAKSVSAADHPAHPIIFFQSDYRVLQIYFISVIGFVFSIWSLAFVFVFRDAAGKMLQRANEIETLFPGLPSHQRHKSFALLNDWYNTPGRATALRTLFWSTVAFYALIFVGYGAVFISAIHFNRMLG